MSADFARVMLALRDAASEHETLTTDTVWPYLSEPPTERNMVGKAFSEANRLGWISGTEQFIKGTRKEAKGRRVQVWRSHLSGT